jgi:antitoxin component YwqK of YwqJK toxin-antitoxin module
MDRKGLQEEMMPFHKLSAVFLSLLMCIAMVSCTREVEERNTVERGGLLYEMGAEQPFTGIVNGRGREDYRKKAYDYKKQYKDGVLNGETVFYFSNGKMESKVPYKDGEINGFMIRYWPNGRPKARIHFVNGLRGGLKGEMFWDENGHQIQN